jgi:succinoglycan biosynthesis protein ExoL
MNSQLQRGELAFFGPERTDARCIKRIAALQDHGWKVLGFLFHRDRGQPAPPAPPWEHVDLGTTYNRRYFHRAWCLLRSFFRVWKLRHRLRECRALYAINPDNALLALFARWAAGRKIPLALEIADVQPVMTRRGPAARALRWLERRILRRSALLVTTSPGFLHYYFTPVQRYTGQVFMLENKVYPSRALTAARQPRSAPAAGGRPWIIGYFGVFRCQRSLDTICRLAAALPDHVRFHLHGVPGGMDPAAFHEQLRHHPNIHCAGPYQYPGDLPALYAAVDLNWCFDYSAPGANSAWLLPNRLYEGGLLHTPALVEEGTETARWVQARGLGWALGGDLFTAARIFLQNLTPEAWRETLDRCTALPDQTCAGESDYADLAGKLTALHPASAKQDAPA